MNDGSGYFPDRARRLGDAAAGLDLTQDFPLLKSGPLTSGLHDRLRETVAGYILGTLRVYFPDRIFHETRDPVLEYAEDILELPNITPNGLVLPKTETVGLYGRVHQVIAEILIQNGLDRVSAGLHVPVNLRLVRGRANPEIDRRPRASSKYHSDVWAGEPANAIMVFLPVFGDTENLGIEWIEPRAFPDNLLQPLSDFDEGRHLIDGLPAYPARFANGDILLSDPFLIHATQKNSDNLRLSIDFRFLARETVDSDATAPGTRLDSYVPFEEWAEIGKTTGIYSAARLEPFQGDDQPTANEYAQQYEVLPFDQQITSIDIAGLLDEPQEDVEAVIEGASLSNLVYRECRDSEAGWALEQAAAATGTSLPRTTDASRLERWNDGWSEVLAKVERDGLTQETLMPGYFRHDTLRLCGRYIRVPDGSFEFGLYRSFARVLFANYLSSADRIVELGAGTGINLHLLHEMYPGKQIIGADWATPSQQLAAKIDGENLVKGVNLDMKSMDGAEALGIEAGTAVVSCHALEQMGRDYSLLVDFLLDRCPSIVLHLEPIDTLYDPAVEFDAIALDYHNNRNYLSGFLKHLRGLESAGQIEVLKVHRTGFGSQFQEAYSVVVWRPVAAAV